MQFYRNRSSQHLLQSAFFRLPETLLVVLDAELKIVMASEAWAQITGSTREALVGRPFLELLLPSDRDEVSSHFAQLDLDNPTQRFFCRCLPPPGKNSLGMAWSVTLDEKSGLIYAAAHETAIQLSATDNRLPETYIDGLTGLPNRSLFLDRIEHTLRRAQRRANLKFAVLYCGIDRFKVVNHSLGDRLGDLLLVNIANVLKGTIRPTDMVARLGGDEFGLLLDDVHDASSPLRVVQRIRERLVLPFPLSEHEVFATVSTGITIGAADYTQPDQLIRDANVAMTRAKAQGGGAYVVFDKTMHQQAVQRMELEMDLRRAVEQQQFQAYYQPIVHLASGRLAGFEALVRWNHPNRGLVSPVDFIPVAEETGLIVPIGMWMLREACRQTRAWQQSFPAHADLDVSVNLSARQLKDPTLPQQVEAILAETGLAPRYLKLEITESAMMEDAAAALQLLQRLAAMDIRLSLDDFGTGYSSLSYLHQLPVHILKVDRSFVQHMHESDADKSFVETIVRLAHQLGHQVISEGVELPEQERLLRELGVEFSQGFLYSRPAAANEAEMLILSAPVLTEPG